jgi:hypothetical protein
MSQYERGFRALRFLAWAIVLGLLALGIWAVVFRNRYPRLRRTWWWLSSRQRQVLWKHKQVLEDELRGMHARLDQESANRPPPAQLAPDEHWINAGIKIEQPSVWVPWGLPAIQLKDLLRKHGLVESPNTPITCLKCIALGGLPVTMEFDCHHLFPPHELMSVGVTGRIANVRWPEAYEAMQSKLVACFGSPSRSRPSPEPGFTDYEWDCPYVMIVHSVRERFGPNEVISIRRKTAAETAARTGTR